MMPWLKKRLNPKPFSQLTKSRLSPFFFEGINHTNDSSGPVGQRNRYPSTISSSYYRLQKVSIFNTSTCGQTNRCIQQTVEQCVMPTGQSTRYRSTISHIFQVQVKHLVDIDRQFHVPISHRKYRSTISRAYWSQ